VNLKKDKDKEKNLIRKKGCWRLGRKIDDCPGSKH
jgi:hypothetical protein